MQLNGGTTKRDTIPHKKKKKEISRKCIIE